MPLMSDESLRFPIGRLSFVPAANADLRATWIAQIAETPARVADAVKGLTPDQLATRYRDGGWTLAQVVNHLADSHVNAYIRMRFIIAEDGFTVKPYAEGVWAELPDARAVEIEPSLELLRGLHTRWTAFLKALEPAQFDRPYSHPESGPGTLDKLIQIYAWHGRHHAAHITTTRARHGW